MPGPRIITPGPGKVKQKSKLNTSGPHLGGSDKPNIATAMGGFKAGSGMGLGNMGSMMSGMGDRSR